jgi:DNA-binding beta-propeller fold protein YncE
MISRKTLGTASDIRFFGSITLICVGLAALALAGAPVKLKVTHLLGAPVYRTAAIGQPVTTHPLNAILNADGKQGEFWKITFDLNGVKTTGFVHEFLVEEVSEDDLAGTAAPLGLVKTQPELVAEIELKIEGHRDLIVQEKELPAQVDSLQDLLPKVFGIEDVQKQRQLACDIYHWIGQALSKQGDDLRAIKEFKNMFTVDYLSAKRATKYLSDPNISQLIATAEKQYNGTFVSYSVQVDTEPKEAVIKVNGKVWGQSPDVVQVDMPRITLEVEKEGYKPEKTILTLTDAKTVKTFVLQSIARLVHVGSEPPGAAVYLDGRDSGKLTECDLGLVPYGSHKLTVKKAGYADWEDDLIVDDGTGPLSRMAVLPAKSYFPVFTWGGLDAKGTSAPRAMALDADGSYYIVSSGIVKVRKYNRDRGATVYWGVDDKELKALKEPAGLVVAKDGSCYITDKKACTVLKVDKNGKYLLRWGKPGLKDGELMAPTGIAVDQADDVYVVDSGNSRIVKFSPKGVVKRTWGKQGPGQGEFYFPAALAVNSRNEIIVVDAGRIQKFSAEGAFIEAFGKQASPEAELKRPQGVCCDAQDSIFVADPATNRVLKFLTNGRFVGAFGGTGSDPGQLSAPVTVVVNGQGSVFVLEAGNKRIQEFQPPAK